MKSLFISRKQQRFCKLLSWARDCALSLTTFGVVATGIYRPVASDAVPIMAGKKVCLWTCCTRTRLRTKTLSFASGSPGTEHATQKASKFVLRLAGEQPEEQD